MRIRSRSPLVPSADLALNLRTGPTSGEISTFFVTTKDVRLAESEVHIPSEKETHGKPVLVASQRHIKVDLLC